MSDYDAFRESFLSQVDRQLQTFKERDRDIQQQKEELRVRSEELERESRRLETERSKLEHEKSSMACIDVTDADVVELNVQGELISTLRGTLRQVSSNRVLREQAAFGML